MNQMNESQYIYYLAHMLDEAFDKSADSSPSSSYAKRLARAKKTKDDEFYTSYGDSDRLLRPFASSHFRGKKVLMNCDDPVKSEMFRYMNEHFDEFGLKELKCVGYGCTELLIVTKMDTWDTIPISNNGDFRTGESLQALKECDIVVSNPPFSRASDSDEYSLGQDFFRLAIENRKDVIGINDIRNVSFGILKDYILERKLKVYKCPYDEFGRPEDKAGSNNVVQCVVLSTIKDVAGVASGLKVDTNSFFKQADELGLKYIDLPEYPLSKISSVNDRRVDVRVLNLAGFKSNAAMPIPRKPSAREVAYEIQKPKIAIPYFQGLVMDWEKHFNLVDLRKITATLDVGGSKVSVNNSYCVFEYR